MQQKNFKLNQNPFIYKLHPEFTLNHFASGDNHLYVKLNLFELMFIPLESSKALQSKVEIKYALYKPDDLENIIDSSSVSLAIKKRKGQTNAITYLPINDNGLKEYYIKIITIDMFRRRAVKDFLHINYEAQSAKQNFSVKLNTSTIPYFRSYFRDGQVFYVEHNSNSDSIFVKRLFNDSIFPAPPYSIAPYMEPIFDCDSTYNVSGSRSIKFSENRKGLYYFQTDTNDNTGLCLLNAGKDFPYVKSSLDMLYPVRYLCKKREFEELEKSPNKKLALDRFWLKCGGNMNRARELIRIYYSRVLYANVYFTAFTEGWKTDRGMIYLLFGTPKNVKKEADKEIWIYTNRSNSKILQFVFNRQPSAYSDNNYVLERSNDFRRFWVQAIKSWRAGKIYIIFANER